MARKFLTFAVLFIGMILTMAASLLSGITQGTTGAAIFIGPIPIGFGYGPHALLIFSLALLITILGIILFLMSRKK